MRIAALALVLIVASAVVLVFANTLNSWVLGGLIGGLAALLISIPISLIIFTTLARRQDERMLAQHEEDMTYEEYEEYDDYHGYDEYSEVYETEAYVLPSEDEEFEQLRGRRQPEVRGLPAAGQSYASYSGNVPANQRPLNNPQGYRRPTRDLPAAQERNRGASTQRQVKQTGHQRQARSPHTTRSLRSQQHAAALRAARQEAEREHYGTDQLSTGPVRRPTTTRHLPPQSIQFHRSHLHDEANKTEKTQPTSTRRTKTNSDASNRNRPPRTDDLRPREMQTDQLRGQNPVTGPVRLNPETGKIVRNPQLGEYSGETMTGTLKNPLVRRAPYLYEDDPLREELAQQIEKPITRRSSLYQSFEGEED